MILRYLMLSSNMLPIIFRTMLEVCNHSFVPGSPPMQKSAWSEARKVQNSLCTCGTLFYRLSLDFYCTNQWAADQLLVWVVINVRHKNMIETWSRGIKENKY